MPRLQVSVSETLHQRIKKQADKDGVSVSQLVRTAVSNHLHTREMAEK